MIRLSALLLPLLLPLPAPAQEAEQVPTEADYALYGKTLQGCYLMSFDGNVASEDRLKDCVGRVKTQCEAAYTPFSCGKTEASMWLMVNDFYNESCPDKAKCAAAYKDFSSTHMDKVKDWRDTSEFYAEMIAHVHNAAFADYGPLTFTKKPEVSATIPVEHAPVRDNL